MPIKDRFDNYERKTNKHKKTHLMPCCNKDDVYRHYKKNFHNDIKDIYKLNRKEASQILDIYNLSLKELLKTGCLLILPNTLGGLQLLKTKVKSQPKKEELYRKVTFDTEFYIPIINWLKYSEHKKAKLRNIMMYSFKVTRQVKDELVYLFDNTNLAKKVYSLKGKG